MKSERKEKGGLGGGVVCPKKLVVHRSSVISVIGHCKFGVIRPSSDPGILGEIKYKRGGDTEKLGEYRAILLGREFGIWNHKH